MAKERFRRVRFAIGLAFLWALMGCGPNLYDEIELMPAPTVYAEAGFDPYVNVSADNVTDRVTLFFATDRMPAGPDDPQRFYNNERGFLLRTGIARVEIEPSLTSWDEIRSETLSGTRSEDYSLRVSEAQEIGALPFSITRYLEDPPAQQDMELWGSRFAARINAQLAASVNKDIFIYVHGYNVDFDYSSLVSKQLQHFLGYQGAFISYNWTATPSRFAYFRDQEAALATRRNLRELISYLSENTGANRIHLIGYSAGSRLVFETAYQITLQPEPKPKIGQLVLIGSDLDRVHFLQAIEDGLLDTASDVTLYQSRTDSALALSRFIYGRERVGQASESATNDSTAAASLSKMKNLHIIDVTEAEEASAGNGHWYFRSSPWASSDLFITLLSKRSPGERGLVRAPNQYVWQFPSNYPQVLKSLGSNL